LCDACLLQKPPIASSQIASLSLLPTITNSAEIAQLFNQFLRRPLAGQHLSPYPLLQLTATSKLSLLLLCYLLTSQPKAALADRIHTAFNSTIHYSTATCQPPAIAPADSSNTAPSHISTTTPLSASPARTMSATTTTVCLSKAPRTCIN